MRAISAASLGETKVEKLFHGIFYNRRTGTIDFLPAGASGGGGGVVGSANVCYVILDPSALLPGF